MAEAQAPEIPYAALDEMERCLKEFAAITHCPDFAVRAVSRGILERVMPKLEGAADMQATAAAPHAERPNVTPNMVSAGAEEIYARLPDVVFVAGDAEQLVRNIWAAMSRAQQVLD